MPTDKKKNRKYVFTVEGETEQWYFEWLQNQINSCNESKYNVSIVAKVQQSPRKYAKTVNPISTPQITHICDYESNEEFHVEKFKDILNQLQNANSINGRNFKYGLGYSNFTFELWIVLHKLNFNSCLAHRTQYLTYVNRAFGEQFGNLDQYKHEKNFKRCLSKLSLSDVKEAIKRAKYIMKTKEANGEHQEIVGGFKYYKENPALTIWESIEAILKECGLLKN